MQPRELDSFSKGQMKEDGVLKAAAPQRDSQLGWVYHNGHFYMFTSYHLDFLKAEEQCNHVGAYLADILTKVVSKHHLLANRCPRAIH